MFILYAMPVGLLLGWLGGGRFTALTTVPFRWAPLALVGFLAQVVLFLGPVAERVGALGAPLYVASSLLVLAVVVRNLRIGGMALVALGAAANLAAIVANGGQMPASAAALAAAGRSVGTGFSNSTVAADPALAPLTDVFALPAWLPYANVFSIGDVLIGLGIAWALAAGMRASGASGNLLPRFSPPSTDVG